MNPAPRLGRLALASAATRLRLVATIGGMVEDGRPLQEQLEEIGAQLDWVREYL